jgi:hypothetical protein
MSLNQSQGSRTVVEPVALGSQTLSDNELSSLTLSHTGEPYDSNDYETLANIEAELECMNAEEVMTTQEETNNIITMNNENESILPEVMMSDGQPQEVQTEQIIYTTANQSSQNLILQTKPTLQRVPSTTSVQVCYIRILYFKSKYSQHSLNII